MSNPRKPVPPEERAFYKAVGLRLTRFREKAGFTQEQTAAALRIAQPTYAAYETGKNRLPLFLLALVAKLFKTDAGAFVDIPVRPAPKRRSKRA